MKRIASFEVDHTKFGVGMYISRIDGDVITYDVRMVIPNGGLPDSECSDKPAVDLLVDAMRIQKENSIYSGGLYLSNSSIHTIEHLFATYARNSKYSDDIVYVGPMGCRTGFYFLTRDTVPKIEAIKIVKEAMKFIRNYNENDKIPGSTIKECGNYLDHNLSGAKMDVVPLLEKLEGYTEEMLDYKYKGIKENE